MTDLLFIKQIVTAAISIVVSYFVLRERIVKLEHRVTDAEKDTEKLVKIVEKNSSKFEESHASYQQDISEIKLTLQDIKSYMKHARNESI